MQSRAQLIFIGLTLGLNSHGVIRFGESNRFQLHLLIFQAQSVVGAGVSQLTKHADVAPGQLRNRNGGFAQHCSQTADFFLLALGGIVKGGYAFHFALANLKQVQLAHKRVADRFENQRRQRFALILSRQTILRRGQIGRAEAQQNINAHIVQSRTAKHRSQQALGNSAA